MFNFSFKYELSLLIIILILIIFISVRVVCLKYTRLDSYITRADQLYFIGITIISSRTLEISKAKLVMCRLI